MLDNKVESSGPHSNAALRDVIINNYALNNELIVIGIEKRIEEINKKVKEILPNDIHSRKTNGFVKFDSEILLTSLLEIAIPLTVALDLIEIVPNSILEILEKNSSILISTSDIRRIIYKAICNRNYSKYGKQIQKWGENYARRYGNPNVQIFVIKQNNEEVPLDYELIEDQLIPILFEKCYGKDLTDDLKLLESSNVIQTCASEILQAVRSLNIYHIRYGTLHKIAYDLATQLPHPWFTNKEFKQKHLEYHFSSTYKHYENICNNVNIVHSIEECIEHSCSLLLTEYELFIGTGKLRPLYSLIRYLDTESIKGNPLLWEQTNIDKIKGDLNSYSYSLNLLKFRKLLTDIKSNIFHLHNKTESELELIIDLTKKLYEIVSTIYENINSLKLLKNNENKNYIELSNSSILALSFIDKINLDKNKAFFKHNFEGEGLKFINYRIRISYILIDDIENFTIPHKCEYSDTTMYITDKFLINEKRDFIFEKADSKNIFFLEFNELIDIVDNNNRYENFINKIIEKLNE